MSCSALNEAQPEHQSSTLGNATVSVAVAVSKFITGIRYASVNTLRTVS